MGWPSSSETTSTSNLGSIHRVVSYQLLTFRASSTRAHRVKLQGEVGWRVTWPWGWAT